MTIDQTPRAVFHVSSRRGDDELGDGSLECPWASKEHAEDIDPDAVLFIDGIYSAPSAAFNDWPDFASVKPFTGSPLSMSDSGWLVFAAAIVATWAVGMFWGWGNGVIAGTVVAVVGGTIVASRSEVR